MMPDHPALFLPVCLILSPHHPQWAMLHDHASPLSPRIPHSLTLSSPAGQDVFHLCAVTHHSANPVKPAKAANPSNSSNPFLPMIPHALKHLTLKR
jgi:hypothetical protein